MRNYPRCKTCRFWGAGFGAEQWNDPSGKCGRIYEGAEDGALARTFNHFGDDSGLETDAKFGCVLHEAKP